MGSEQSSPKSNRPNFVPNTRQNHVTREYERAQAELKEIYEQRLLQERFRESSTRSTPQTVQSQIISQDQASTIRTNKTLNQQTQSASVSGSGHTMTRNWEPQIETTQMSAKQHPNPSLVKQSVAASKIQTIQSNQIITRNQAPQPEATRIPLKQQCNPSMVTQSVASSGIQRTQSGFSQPRLGTTSNTHTQSDITTSLERNRTPYSYSSNELQNAIQHDKRTSIYPNLNKETTCTSQGSTLAQGPSHSSADIGQDFIFVNRSNETNRFTPSAPSRDRSQSSDSRPRSRTNKQKSDHLSCRTCNGKFSLKIYQCPNGHSSCSDCRSSNASCGLCRLKITDMRNIMLEDYISQQKIPCVNAADGCCLLIKMLDMENHIKQCPFKEIICPINGTCGDCNWRGKTSQLAGHFNDVHPMQTQGDVNTEMILLNIWVESHTLYLVTMGTFNFLVHIKVCERERKIFMAVQLLGTAMSAAKWNYEIHVYNKREPRRKYQFADICTSASTITADLFKDSNCATLPLSYASTFVNDGVLYYKFYIKQQQNQEVNTDFNKNRRGRGAFRGRH